MNIRFRQATAADKDFLIQAIINAEKSGSDSISYCAIFSISESTLYDFLSNALDEEIEGQELYIPNFLIATVDDEPAAAISTWIENEHGMASNLIKSNLLMYFLGSDTVINATHSLQLMNKVNIPRESGVLQIECVYTGEKYRGYGLASKLIDEHIRLKQAAGKVFHKAQVILLKNNEPAIKAYQKAGFSIVAEKKSNNAAILQLLPCDTKILMEKTNLI